MTDFRVSGIVDGDTFDVSGGWTWKGQRGTRIRPTGYDAPELPSHNGLIAKNRLSSLILNKVVQIGPAYRIDRGRLVAEVYFNGHRLADYFPEYRN